MLDGLVPTVIFTGNGVLRRWMCMTCGNGYWMARSVESQFCPSCGDKFVRKARETDPR